LEVVCVSPCGLACDGACGSDLPLRGDPKSSLISDIPPSAASRSTRLRRVTQRFHEAHKEGTVVVYKFSNFSTSERKGFVTPAPQAEETNFFR